MSLFQSNLRKQIRNLPKILNFVKIIHYYSKLFTGVLNDQRRLLREHEVPVQGARGAEGERPRERVRVAERLEERTWVAKTELS